MFDLKSGQVESRSFAEDGVIVFRNCLPAVTMSRLWSAIAELEYKRKDIEIGGTPRRMSACGGREVARHDLSYEIINAFYKNAELLKALTSISGVSLVPCDDPVEWVISSRMEFVGDTHGWHYDDYPFAFILICAAPDAVDCGGEVEIERRTGVVQKIRLRSGDCYFMRSDIIRHRVAPLRVAGQPRVMLNFTYASEDAIIVPQGSAEVLCA